MPEAQNSYLEDFVATCVADFDKDTVFETVNVLPLVNAKKEYKRLLDREKEIVLAAMKEYPPENEPVHPGPIQPIPLYKIKLWLELRNPESEYAQLKSRMGELEFLFENPKPEILELKTACEEMFDTFTKSGEIYLTKSLSHNFSWLSNFPRVRILYLTGPSFEGLVDLNDFRDLRNLETLVVSDARLNGIDLDLTILPLKTIRIHASRAEFLHIKGSSDTLKRLEVTGNYLSLQGIVIADQLSNLQTFDLRDNGLQWGDLSGILLPDHRALLPSLKNLGLDGNAIDAQQIRAYLLQNGLQPVNL